MKVQSILILFAIYINASSTQNSDTIRSSFRFLRDFGLNFFGRSINEPQLFSRAVNLDRIQKRMPETMLFPCADPNDAKIHRKSTSKKALPSLAKFRSKERPTSVHALRPGDIDVVGAMGDSLTAANGAGATNIFQVLTENRGVSWSIGGQDTWKEFLTVPNILKEFNPKLVGFSLGDSLGFHRAAQFNAAEAGAMTEDLPHMAKELVKRMYKDPRVNIKEDWKLITLMIGPNNFCLDVCYLDNLEDALEIHKKTIIAAMTTLRDNLPRTLVNIAPAPDVHILKTFTNRPPLCIFTHLAECPCLFGESHKWAWKKMADIINRWKDFDFNLDTHPEFIGREDFAIVVQPFTMNIVFPVDSEGITDYTHLSEDCFHFSQKGYARAANAIWNNMMEPVGKKTTNWTDLFSRFLCPTDEHPYIYTRNNSNLENFEVRDEGSLIENNLLKRSIGKK